MPLTARRHIRKMRGGAQSHLVEADDGHYYVVKFTTNPQHRRILVNELIGSAILRYLQISTPETALVQVTDVFLEDNREVSLHVGKQEVKIKPGWHFGSRFPGNPATTAVYDFVPDALLAKVVNIAEFAAVLVFDKWTSNGDGRQSVFFRAMAKEWLPHTKLHPHRLGFVALMIDHGFIFNGPRWDFTDSLIQGLYPRKLVYQSVRSFADFEPWLERVVHFPEEVIDQTLRRIPPEWLSGDDDELKSMLERLLRRRKRVPDLIADCRLEKTNPFPQWGMR
jgi:hypothetical protein